MTILRIAILLFITHHLSAQSIASDSGSRKERPALFVGYYAPHVLQPGVRMGLNFPIKSWQQQTKKATTRRHILDITPRFGYFTQLDVQRNYISDVTLEYRWFKPHRAIQPKIGLGLGYLLSQQKISGSVNLANGEIDFEKRSLNSFIPTLNVGFVGKGEQLIGYYFTGFYGRKFTDKEVNAGFLGIELGILINLFKNSDNG